MASAQEVCVCVGGDLTDQGVGKELIFARATMSKGLTWDGASSQGYPAGFYMT